MSDILKAKSNANLMWLLFFAATIFMYLCWLWIPLLGPDEPRYSQVAREMFERNDWITPTLGGFNWFEKPALLYWLQIAAYKIFGVSEFSARLGPALFGLLTIFSLWVMAKLTVSDSKTFAKWLALIAASSIGLLVFSRGASFDIVLTFPITASLVGFLIFDQGRNPAVKYSGLIAFYFFIGVSLLAKGLVGIVFPFAIVGLYHVLCFEYPNRAFVVSWIWGLALAALVASTWYLPMYQTHGWQFIDEFFMQHHFARFTSNKYQHPQPFWFFWVILPLMTMPWLPFLFPALYRFIVNSIDVVTGKGLDGRANSCLTVFAFSWMIVPLVFFSFSGSKLPGYILPALPGAVILIAEYVWEFVQRKKGRAFSMKALAFGTLVLVAIVLQFFVPAYAEHETVKTLISKADEAGYSKAKIYNFHRISHSSEFYAAGRLIRMPDGKQKRYEAIDEIINEASKDKAPMLILVPIEYLYQVTESDRLNSKILGDNGEFAIAAAELR